MGIIWVYLLSLLLQNWTFGAFPDRVWRGRNDWIKHEDTCKLLLWFSDFDFGNENHQKRVFIVWFCSTICSCGSSSYSCTYHNLQAPPKNKHLRVVFFKCKNKLWYDRNVHFNVNVWICDKCFITKSSHT